MRNHLWTKTMNKALRIVLTIMICILVTVILVLALVKIGERLVFFSFYAKSTTEFKVPGVSDGFIEQGFELITKDGEEIYLTSGYMKNGSSSRVYLTDAKGKSLGFTKLRNQTGGRNTTHAGGIAVYGEYVYIATAAKTNENVNSIEVFKLNDILSADEAKCIGTIETPLCPAFVYVDDARGLLYTGNFHKDGTDYLSPEEFIIGDNTAMMLAYELDKSASLGVKDDKADKAYSITSQVQGMTLTDSGKLVLSTSWGISKSHLLIYDFNKINTQSKTIVIDGVEIPLYTVDSENLLDDVKAPPMAEELVYKDGKVYIMNESASSKYIFGKFTSGNYVHTYKVD